MKTPGQKLWAETREKLGELSPVERTVFLNALLNDPHFGGFGPLGELKLRLWRALNPVKKPRQKTIEKMRLVHSTVRRKMDPDKAVKMVADGKITWDEYAELLKGEVDWKAAAKLAGVKLSDPSALETLRRQYMRFKADYPGLLGG